MTSFDDNQVMVTLAAMSYGVPKPDPGLTADQRMQAILREALGNRSLATQGAWVVAWVAQSADESNLVFIAQNTTDDKLAVVIRGTVFSISCDATNNIYEDLRVGITALFSVDGKAVDVSYGSSVVFADLMKVTFDSPGDPLHGMALHAALSELIGHGSPTIYVTGHSLGGCAATMVALALHAVLSDHVFQVYTYAAPTAGLRNFAALFDATFGGGSPTSNSSWRVVNVWDLVPHAWASLLQVIAEDWYPKATGPARDWDVLGTLVFAAALPMPHIYVQPSTNLVTVNHDAPYGTKPMRWDPDSVAATDEAFIGQVTFQHSLLTVYMPALGAPVPAPALRPPGSSGTMTLVEPGITHTLSTDGARVAP